MYIENIIFPQTEGFRRTYPMNVLSNLGTNVFPITSPITLIYGSNGSGKSTLLNIISKSLGCDREIHTEAQPFYDQVAGKLVLLLDEIAKATTVHLCRTPRNQRLITSAEVLEKISLKNDHNNGLFNDIKNEIQRMDRWEWQEADGTISDGADYLRKLSERDKYHRMSMKGKKVLSNGEEMLEYFYETMDSNSLYLLDEPENCLSPVYQKKLAGYISELTQNCHCQFLIASHSPFFLSLENAQIINIDDFPATTSNNWCDLENMQPYFQLFGKH